MLGDPRIQLPIGESRLDVDWSGPGSSRTGFDLPQALNQHTIVKTKIRAVPPRALRPPIHLRSLMEHGLLFAWGCVGSACDELLHWASLRRRRTFPTYVRSIKYWVVTALLVLMGGVVALAYGSSSFRLITPLTVLIVGYCAPALIKSLSRALLRRLALGKEVADRPSVASFLSD
jgi:hypothetical protein